MPVAVSSSLAGQSDLVVGNVIGSNIFNILLILGIGAVIAPLIVSQRLVRLDVPLVIGVSVLMLVLALDGKIGRLEGGLLFCGIVAYIAFAIVQGRREEDPAVRQEYRARVRRREAVGRAPDPRANHHGRRRPGSPGPRLALAGGQRHASSPGRSGSAS